MSLKQYQKKRNFDQTPEPKGRVKKSLPKKIFVVQKHAASHLHYDFRLELNGVLISWAIPKGPSLDPATKRLAMHVEDHPIEYGSFEGIIPQGQYGGGTVMLWDKGKWECEEENPTSAYQKGNLTFILKGKKLKGKWKLIRINKNDKTWLLIKIKDEYTQPNNKYDITLMQPNSVVSQRTMDEIAQKSKKVWGKSGKKKLEQISDQDFLKKIPIKLSKKAFPQTLYPQLAILVDKPPEGDGWLHEIKFDGYRLLIFKQGTKIKILTRHQHDWTTKFKSLAQDISQLPIKNIILDGEVVVLDQNQHSDFQLLQNSIKEGKANFIFYTFDLLYFDKYNLLLLPLIERKKLLQQFLDYANPEYVRYSDHVLGSGRDILQHTCALGLEGIISKKINSVYAQKRDAHWLKTKCLKRQEFVIGGFLESSRRSHFRSLMLGTFNKKGELNYHGNVGTGFTAKSLENIYELLIKHKSKEMPFAKRPPASKQATWIKPVIVAEIEFTEWTDDYTLRHPSFKGIRSDKKANEITKEVEVPIENILDKKEHIKPNAKPIVSYRLTHPDKVLYAEDKITKQHIAEYYESIQEWILPYLVQRPLTFVRCPTNYKKCFYQKHIAHTPPQGLYGVMIKEKDGKKEEYFYLKDSEGLMALSQLSILEVHPWGCRVDNIEYPDLIIFDLDPGPQVTWAKVVTAAREIKSILASVHLKCFVKTTGGKGLHVVAPISADYKWSEIKKFSQLLVMYLVENNPKDYIGKMEKSARTKKIFVDYLRNQRGATAIAPYSTRARVHAPVATPIAWDELTNNIRDTSYTIKTLPHRLKHLKIDPWKDFFKIKQSLDLNKIKK